MTEPMTDQIVPSDYPELGKLVWNRNPSRPIDAEDVFHLYERNWRFVEVEALTVDERRLIDELGERFGHGFMLI